MEKTTDKGEQMIPKGYKHTELGVLPKDWEVVRLGDVCEIKKGKVNPKKTETTPCVELEHISQDTGMLLGFIDSREQLSIKNSFSKGDVLFGKLRPYLRKFWRASFDGVCSSEIWVLQGKKVSNAFLFYLVQTARFSQIANATCGTKMPRADWKLMQDENFAIPPLAEQEKIAEILSAWDTQIQNFETLITEKQALKKGLCQTLLTAKTRLKGFSGDWEVVRLGDVCEICNGFAFQSKNFKESGSPIVRISNIKSNNTISLEDMVYFSFDDYKNKNLNKFAIYQNDILVALSGATTGKIGKLKEDVVLYLNQRIGKFQPSERLNSDFLFQCLLLQSDFILLLSGGGAQPNLSTTTIKDKVLISLPPLAEQEKIAEILSEVDNEITLLEQKLESLKSQKRGLMQKLLNGKVRVKI